ncbi:HNH endonuclease [Exiguobacterium indicum]|uniref:HNH endonuclease n=1 Tax=Exiguobacterium indicum TaxID=296995 RepID=A0ABU8ELH3_9BACL
MSTVFLQPAGRGKDSVEHYHDTIVGSIDISTIKPYLTVEQYQEIQEISPKGSVSIWGVTLGKENRTKAKWEKMRDGDLVLFSSKNQINSYGFVTYTIQNAELAEHLWGKDDFGQTWECIYFLDESRKFGMEMSSFNAIVDYGENFFIRGFTAMHPKNGEKFLEYFFSENNALVPPVNEEDYRNHVADNPEGELDAEARFKRRIEQSFLRRTLFGDKTIGTCHICDKEYPVRFLVAAHIKRRSECSREERLDFRNIVLPMCKFGCDDLYENGYIVVRDGKIVSNQKLTTDSLESYMAPLVGKAVIGWNEDNETYFSWHADHHS